MRIPISCFIIMLLLTPTEAKETGQNKVRYGGRLVWGTYSEPTVINPVLTTHSISMALLDLVFNRLVRVNSKGQIEPDLAESWEVSADGLVYTFHMRKGVRFHDGAECTAYDAEFTYDKIIDPAINSPFRSLFELVKEFKATDRYTFRVTLERPSVPFIYKMIREIMPAHIWREADLAGSPFNRFPVGTGPFRFKEWREDNTIVLERNEAYYEGRPYLDSVIVKTFANSQDLWTALMRGEVDFAGFIEREDYQVVKEDPTFNAYAIPADSYYAIFYNTEHAPLHDKRVRQAIACAIDRKSLIRRAAFGYGLECNGPFYPDSLGFNPGVKPIDYDPQKAQALLAEAGFKDTNKDGILEKEGEDLEIRLLVDSRSDAYKRIAMVLRQQLQEIGIRLKAILYNDESMLTEEFLKANAPQVHLRFLFAGADPDQVTIYWYSKESNRSEKLWVYKNMEVDRFFESGENTYNKEDRQRIYQKIHQLIYEEQPACFLYFSFLFHAISKKFQNTEEFFNFNMPIYTIKNWFIKNAD